MLVCHWWIRWSALSSAVEMLEYPLGCWWNRWSHQHFLAGRYCLLWAVGWFSWAFFIRWILDHLGDLYKRILSLSFCIYSLSSPHQQTLFSFSPVNVLNLAPSLQDFTLFPSSHSIHILVCWSLSLKDPRSTRLTRCEHKGPKRSLGLLHRCNLKNRVASWFFMRHTNNLF